MSDGSKGLDPVDQGTAVMLTLALLLAAAAGIWFTCQWWTRRYRKSHVQARKQAARKQRLKQTFSRFSQVDEELTINIDKTDEEILKEYTSNMANPTATGSSRAARASRANSLLQPRAAEQTAQKPYLETDL